MALSRRTHAGFEKRFMKLLVQRIPKWPKLAWVASISEYSDCAQVYCGPMVEIGDDWVAEAVWAGDFEGAGFDLTDIVFGSGVRVRNDRLVFVTSGSTFDRLWYSYNDDQCLVGNSLPALMAVGGLELDHHYLNYSRDVRSVSRGPRHRVRSIPAVPAPIHSAYYCNLIYHNGEVTEEPKPDTAPTFATYDDYWQFLVRTSRALGSNLRDSAREFAVSPLASLSSGYDSTASATVARECGCTEAVSIRSSTSLWRGSDSGASIAAALGMHCREYPRTAANYPLEETLWAACGWSGTVNWSLFDFPDPLCLFFTGCHGEKMWDRVDHDDPDPLVRRDVSSLGFTEFRLVKGVFQCPVPFWGVRHSKELKAISTSEEMRPWSMGKDYDKPIARRIAEDAGVPRKSFGSLKRNSVLSTPFPWPHSRSARESFRGYLSELGVACPAEWAIPCVRWAALLESLIHRNSMQIMNIHTRWRPWASMAAASLTFQWSNTVLARRYGEALRSAGAVGGPSTKRAIP
jgi:hypothetical protein